MVLNAKELKLLIGLLDESGKALESLAATFHRAFPRGDAFKACAALRLMLEDNLLAGEGQVRLCCLWTPRRVLAGARGRRGARRG